MVSLAAETGCRDYQTLWKANEALKEDCPNPNMLLSGLDFKLAPSTKVESKANGKRWTFVVPKPQPVSLKLIVLGADSKPLDGAKWEITGPVKDNGETAGGKIEIQNFPPTAKNATLRVTPPPPPQTNPSNASPSSGSDAYPPPIKPSEFVHPGPGQAGVQIIEWSLNIGSLAPAASKPGVLARLHNLGAPCESGNEKPLARTVKAYQRAFLNKPSPSSFFQDIQSDLETRHDKP
jgi:hypothetical protein